MVKKTLINGLYHYVSDKPKGKIKRLHDNNFYSEIVSRKDIEKELSDYGE